MMYDIRTHPDFDTYSISDQTELLRFQKFLDVCREKRATGLGTEAGSVAAYLEVYGEQK